METLQAAEVFEQVHGVVETGFSCPQRVLWVSREENLLIAIGIEKSLKQPRTYELGTVMSLLSEGALRRTESPRLF
jgi:putative transposase